MDCGNSPWSSLLRMLFALKIIKLSWHNQLANSPAWNCQVVLAINWFPSLGICAPHSKRRRQMSQMCTSSTNFSPGLYPHHCRLARHGCRYRFDGASLRCDRKSSMQAESNRSPQGFGKKPSNPTTPKKKKKKKKKGAVENEPFVDFEESMLEWDDCFAAASEDPEKVAEIVEVAKRGHSRHGRGAVYVRASLKRQRQHGKRAAKALINGETSTGGTPLETNADLLVMSWSVLFVPGELLIPLGGAFGSNDGSFVPTPESLADKPAPRPEDYDVDAGVVAELLRSFRGQDTARLLTLVGVLPEGCEGAGEESYEPTRDELVVLLKTTIDGTPLLGADVAAIDLSDDGGLKLVGNWSAVEA